MDKQSLIEIKKRYDEDGFVILKNYFPGRENYVTQTRKK